ncbi:hypothetical protein CERZMDRAFT_86262 [Cercospora zeae-maydis SCOH1-5]|uniref:Uncharacterized protein n=1 Tax=Cercospora zeae-maydis SCOH1-5 TaxID=717836 RepID=A0A6A6F9W2_9PEZI|nr:hypothetical protein CERZMDRAFT_86262 [Cercospora zeae-maydis SCOH1-5]
MCRDRRGPPMGYEDLAQSQDKSLQTRALAFTRSEWLRLFSPALHYSFRLATMFHGWHSHITGCIIPYTNLRLRSLLTSLRRDGKNDGRSGLQKINFENEAASRPTLLANDELISKQSMLVATVTETELREGGVVHRDAASKLAVMEGEVLDPCSETVGVSRDAFFSLRGTSRWHQLVPGRWCSIICYC